MQDIGAPLQGFAMKFLPLIVSVCLVGCNGSKEPEPAPTDITKTGTETAASSESEQKPKQDGVAPSSPSDNYYTFPSAKDKPASDSKNSEIKPYIGSNPSSSAWDDVLRRTNPEEPARKDKGQRSDADWEKAITGVWNTSKESKEARFRLRTSFDRDGGFFLVADNKEKGESTGVVANGEWRVKGGELRISITKSSFPEALPEGLSVNKLLSVNDRELVYLNDRGNAVILNREK